MSESHPDLAAFAGTSRFRPIAFLGRGSKGFVHRVLDEETGTEVALKTLDARDPDQLYHLKQEFRVLAGITHPNLVELYELIVGENASFFTMELVDGITFTTHARNRLNGGPGSRLTPPHGLALGRFIETAEQLVIGVSALHAANRLHRDIKPSNILVTTEGRVVLLDFGLATTLVSGETASGAVGTLAYVAPEQAWGQIADRASDWYGVGVVFYEALTGRLPFDGAPAQILLRKVQSKPAPPASLFPGIPRELDALTMSLLEPEPTKRPPAEAILDVVARLRSGTRPYLRASSARITEPPFVGRNSELAKLRFILGSIGPGSPAIAHIHGPSGIGKTELVRRFLSSIQAEPETIVLRGRCHPQESVPYKALDTVIDELSRVLLALPPTLQAEIFPHHAASLTRLFPVLARVPSLAKGNGVPEDAEPYEIRRQGFAALRELLAGLANRQRIVLWIDDLQWGDLDSAALLRELLRPPDAPGLLLLLSYRSQVRDNIRLVDGLAGPFEDLPPDASHEILVGPLDAVETRRLANLLCTSHPGAERSAELIAAECEGSPFFVDQYVRHLELADMGNRTGRFGLADVIRARVEGLPPLARSVLRLASVAGRGLDRSLLLNAAGAEAHGRPVITRLEHERLLRTTTAGRHEPEVETYHDRIREMIVLELEEDDIADCHRRIAEALRRTPEPDPEALYYHYAGAHLPELAGRYAVQAADRAARALAFDRAAALYRHALELDSSAGGGARLHLRLAEALANAGRGIEAGESFEAAARVTGQTASRDDTNELLRRAAEQYLRSGHIDRGISLMRDVLSELGIPLPASRRRALMSSVVKRARLVLRGVRLPARQAASDRPGERLKLEACWAATTGLLGVEPFFADDVGLRFCMDAIAVGNRSDVIRGLGLEAIREACLGGAFFERRTERLLHAAGKIARERGDPYDEAWLRYSAGASAYFQALWKKAVAECDTSVTILRESCRGAAWEIVTGDSFALTALAHMGQLGTLARRLPFSISDGDQRGDLYASTSLRMGIPGLLWLAQDRPDDALEMADTGIARWPNPGKFLVQHYLHLLSTAQADLYVGDVRRAWRRACDAWPQLADILRGVAVARVELRYLRGRAALAAAKRATPSDPHWPAKRLLREAALEARRLSRERLPSAPPYAKTIRAGIAHLEGRDDEACRLLATAEEDFLRADMELHRAAARYQSSRLRGGEEGNHMRTESEAWMHEQAIRRPGMMAETLVPGFSE